MSSALILQIGLTIGLGLALIASLGLAAMSPMLGDDPATAHRPEVLVMVYSLFALPVVIVIALIAVWLFWAFNLPTTAICLVSLLPVVNIVVFFGAMQLLRRNTP